MRNKQRWFRGNGSRVAIAFQTACGSEMTLILVEDRFQWTHRTSRFKVPIINRYSHKLAHFDVD